MQQFFMVLPVILPVIFWAAYHYHKDRHLPEPPRNLLLCFVLGLLAAGAAKAMYLGLGPLGLRFDAVELAASLAEMDAYGIKHIEKEMSPTEQMILDLIGASALLGMDAAAWVRSPSRLEEVATELVERADAVLRFNDPQGIYAHCFCAID